MYDTNKNSGITIVHNCCMNNLIVKQETKVAIQANKRDILSLYGVPAMLDQIVKKEKSNLLNNLCWGSIGMDSLNKLANADRFSVDIPSGLMEMLKTGEAAFDKSTKNPGSFTPNIRIKGEKGIKAQATIIQDKDPLALTQSMANLAFMAMIQSVLIKLDAIEGKLDNIEQGQKDDRIGNIIGTFSHFVNLYPGFKDINELRNAANTAYIKMGAAFAQLHLQIDAERKKLIGAPANHWETLWLSIIHPFCNETERYQKCYETYVYDIQLYNRLLLLGDVILHFKGDDDVIKSNHNKMIEYSNEYIDDTFIRRMNYLMNGETSSIDEILKYNKNINLLLESNGINDILIECDCKDISCLNFN